MDLKEHPKQLYETRLAPEGERIRAVNLGVHPDKVQGMAAMLSNDSENLIQVVAGTTDLISCAAVLNSQIPPVDLFLCGGGFELDEVRGMLAQVKNPNLRMIKVPTDLMMQGGGPQAVKAWIYEQVRNNTFTPTSATA